MYRQCHEFLTNSYLGKRLLMKNALLTTFAVLLSSSSTLLSMAQVPTAKPRVKPTISGIYTEKASGDTLEVREVKGGKIYFHLNAYYPCSNPSLKDRPGGPNIGEAESTVPLVNNKAVYSTSEYGGKCRITMEFKDGKVTIDQDEPDIGCCGFGMNVNASGTYAKKLTTARKRHK